MLYELGGEIEVWKYGKEKVRGPKSQNPLITAHYGIEEWGPSTLESPHFPSMIGAIQIIGLDKKKRPQWA